METIGEYLKRVRNTCGYSLEDVAGITKINLRYLEAIEHDDISRIPGDTFYLGFVRSYAKCLGISEDEITRRIKETGKTEPQAPAVATPHGLDDQTIKKVVITPEKARIIVPAVAGFIVIALILIIFIAGRDRETIRNAKEPKEVPVSTGEVQTQVAQKVVEPVVIKIYARELTWLSARIDDKETKDVLLKPGEGVMWNGEGKIILTVGNAGGIDVQVNGKTLEPIGKSGEVVRDVVITSEGIRRSNEQ